jgi:hypothetical protein
VHKDLLAHSPLLVLPLMALVLFVAVFFVVCVRTMAKRAPAYARVASLPLDEQEGIHEH